MQVDLDRFRGCLLGLPVGDAVGTTVEFQRRGSFPLVTDMVGGGPFRLEPGQWTDDTSMALCLAPAPLFYFADLEKEITDFADKLSGPKPL